MSTTRQSGAHRCPTDPAHGWLITWQGKQPFHCPHTDHDGRPTSHRKGQLERSRSFFGYPDVEGKP